MMIHKEKATILSLILTLLLCVFCSTTFAGEQQLLAVQNYGHPDAIVDEYIITFGTTTRSKQTMQPAVAAVQAEIIADDGVIKRQFQTFNGFSARMSAEALESVRANPNVQAIEANLVVMADEVESWGLDRIDDRDLPLDNSYEYDGDGSGVTAYIIDSGIRATHEQFGNRVIGGFTTVNDGYGWDDCHGHGTHVAGTVGGATVGVAPGVSLVAVRVLNCNNSASLDGIVEGVEWVIQNAVYPAVANMSLSYNTTSDTLDSVVRTLANQGVIVANSAGNRGGADACNYSPQPVAEVITVGSSDVDDRVSDFSNLGTCVDIFAPGRDIISASNGSDTGLTTKLGTSMATPHVAGCAARYLDEFPGAIAGDVVDAITGGNDSSDSSVIGDSSTESDSGVVMGDGYEIDAILGAASENVLTGFLDGAPNRLLYCNFGDSNNGGGTPTPTPTPVDENIIYEETFDTDNGDWAFNPNRTDTATNGLWEIGTAEATYSEEGPPYQAAGDGVLVTGALADSNFDVYAYDVDDGTTSIQSPPIEIPADSGASLSLSYYMAHADDATNDDSLIIQVIGSSRNQTIIREFGNATQDYGEWRTSHISLSRFEGDTIRLLITATDNGASSLIEAAVDDILIKLPSSTSTGGDTPTTPPPSGNGIAISDAIIDNDEIGTIPTSISLSGQNALSSLSIWIVLMTIPLGVATVVTKQ